MYNFDDAKDILARARKTLPWVPVGHPKYQWFSGADVQRTWRRHGWVPPSDKRTAVYAEPVAPAWVSAVGVRRVK